MENKEEVETVTFKQLRDHVRGLATAMRKMGIETGDRVVGEQAGPAVLVIASPKCLEDVFFFFLVVVPPPPVVKLTLM